MPEAEKKKLEEALAASKKVLENDKVSIDELQASLNELTNVSHALSSVLYEKQKTETAAPPSDGGSSTPPPGGDGAANDDNVIDADYKDVN